MTTATLAHNSQNNHAYTNGQSRNNANLPGKDAKDLSASRVLKFYEGKNILITGATGFLGKVLLWKFLDACSNVGDIYVLLRPKNNQSAEKRMAQLLRTKPFNYNEQQHGHLLKKVIAIDSDITKIGLGLSEQDSILLREKVNIVFHCAASVKFNAPLKDNLRDNFYGSKYVIDLCNTIKNFNGLVHVSTAYSNCHKKEIGEKIVPLEREIDDIVSIVENDVLDSVTDRMLEGRPNTYTFTKAMAEQYVSKQEGKYPISIVRPSIVVNSIKEPQPGWVDNVNGISGLGSLASVGLLRTIDWNYDAISDMVPVDVVANCLICVAYQSAEHSPDKLLIYNMTSGNMNPVSWGQFFQMLKNTATKTPPNKIVRPMIDPPKHKRANPISFFMTKIFSELLFAYLIDTILVLIGYKGILVKITQKMHNGYKILLPFTTGEWNFTCENVENLYDSLQPVDRELFGFDMRNFDWEEEAYHLWQGVRHHIFKEDPTEESFKSGLRRQTIVTMVHYTGLAIIFSLIGYLLYSVIIS